MVRFARAEGSKGSNKKQLEEPTPWAEMVSQLDGNKKRKKNEEEGKSGTNDGISGHTIKKKKNIGTEGQQNEPQNSFQAVKNQKPPGKNEESLSVQTNQSTVKKNKKEKKKGAKTSEPEYTITPEGKKVKVFRDGTARTWFDLPYEESDTMTRYDGFWVKKGMAGELDRLKDALEEGDVSKKEMMRRMMKAKRKAHRELRIELIYQQKSLVSEAMGVNGKEKSEDTKRTRKKKKQKVLMTGDSSNTENSMQTKASKRKLQDENTAQEIANTEEEQIADNHDGDGEDDTKQTMASLTDGSVKKKKKKRKTNNSDGEAEKESAVGVGVLEEISSEVNGKVKKGKKDKKRILTTQDNCKEEFEAEAEAGPSQANTEDNEGSDKEATLSLQVNDKKAKEKKKRNADRPETEMAKLQNDTEDNEEVDEPESTKSITNAKEETYNCNLSKMDHTSSSQGDFEENELMTKYEDYWVLREEVEDLEAVKKLELEAVYAARTDGSKGELSEKEQIIFQRAMKKRKRFYRKKLLQRLYRMGRKVDGDRMGKQGSKKEDDSGKVAKFDGFWVKKEAADRLHKLRNKLQKEGLSQQEVDSVVQKERRKEERVLKNERKLVCLNCRQPGHMVSACPNIAQADGEGQPSICYTCGSTEHTSSSCNLKKGSEKSFSFATCYICGETGHISRQCPDNPRGLYPKGGACRGCGSVEHLAKDCPDLQKEKAESSIRVGRLKGEELEALDEDADEAADQDVSATHSKGDKPKVVKF